MHSYEFFIEKHIANMQQLAQNKPKSAILENFAADLVLLTTYEIMFVQTFLLCGETAET